MGNSNWNFSFTKILLFYAFFLWKQKSNNIWYSDDSDSIRILFCVANALIFWIHSQLMSATLMWTQHHMAHTKVLFVLTFNKHKFCLFLVFSSLESKMKYKLEVERNNTLWNIQSCFWNSVNFSKEKTEGIFPLPCVRWQLPWARGQVTHWYL